MRFSKNAAIRNSRSSEAHSLWTNQSQPELPHTGRHYLDPAMAQRVRFPPQVALRFFAAALFFFALPVFLGFFSRLDWDSTALSMDLARNKSGRGATPV